MGAGPWPGVNGNLGGEGDDTQGHGTGRASILSPRDWGVRKAPQLHTLSKGYSMNDQLHTQHSRKGD